MGKRVKLSVIYKENIWAVYGNIIEERPLQIECENTDIFQNYHLIILPFVKDNNREILLLEVYNISGNVVSFKEKENISNIFFKNHYVEFCHDFSIKEYDINESEKYKKLALSLNMQELNSTASRLKEVYSRDDVENRELISFLIDINAKIDEILYLLKPKTEIEGAKEYKSILLGEEGVFFISNKSIDKDNIIIYTTIRDSGGFFSFAALCKAEEFKRCDDYIIYKGLFENINADLEDKIIKYIFRLEREMLKEATK